jgi:hypothetical protein
MPTETLHDGRVVPEAGAAESAPDPKEDALRELALQRLGRIRKFKRYLWAYLLAMVVLTPVWILTQYQTADGWPQHLSSRSRYPGDWDPWIIWVALAGAVVVAIAWYRAYIERPDTEADVEREIDRLKSAH